MIKRIAAVVLTIVVLLHAAAFAEADWTLTEAQSLAQHIHGLASDEAYRTTLYTEEVRIKAAELAEADFTEPAAVWRVGIPDVQTLYEMLSAFASTDDSLGNVLNMSDIGFKEFARRVPTSVLSAAVGQAAGSNGDAIG